MSDRQPIIAIDGPSGSGKSTLARLLAARLGLLYLDTGAMYRALTLKAQRAGVSCDDESGLIVLAEATQITLAQDARGALSVHIDSEDVTAAIRDPGVDDAVSQVACHPRVRAWMVAQQRELGCRGAVIEGRDIGSVVFPDADIKFFLDASLDVRANRRQQDLASLHESVSTDAVADALQARDTQDSDRDVGPLIQAPDAEYIDSTHLNIDAVLECMVARVNRFSADQH